MLARLVAGVAALALPFGLAPAQQFEPTWESLNTRTPPRWFHDAKFGIFIHWGVYSVPAFCDTSTYSEWYQHWLDTRSHGGLVAAFHERVYGADFAYRDFAPLFRAELWRPDEWADVFRRAGAKYIVVTSKHHDGFCLWPNQLGSEIRGYPWHAGATGPKRDLLGELAASVRKAGIKFGLYYSFLEWHNPLFEQSIPAYVQRQMIPQIQELVLRYQPSVFWPDGEWEQPDSIWRSTEILQWLYANAQNRDELVVDDRWGKGLRGRSGDFYTTEYGDGGGGGDSYSGKRSFEECRGIGHSFAFNRAEGYDVYLSRTECVRTLIDLVSRGGNLLLDIGPAADGTIPLLMVDRLLAIGRWLERNGEAIYGTEASPFRHTPWGRATQKGHTVYLHLFDWPAGERLQVPLRNHVTAAFVLADQAKAPLPCTPSPFGQSIDLRGRHPEEHATVVALELDGAPDVDQRLLPDSDGAVTLLARTARIAGSALKLESQPDRFRSATSWNLGYWQNTDDTAAWSDVVLEPGVEYDVVLEHAVAPGEEGGEIMVSVGDKPLRSKLGNSTGGWDRYVAIAPFTVTRNAAAAVTVTVKAARVPHTALCNLRSITFRPSSNSGDAGPSALALRREVRAAFDRMERLLRQGDLAGVAHCYADDAVLLAPGMAPSTGRAAIDRYWLGIEQPQDWRLEIFDVRGGGDLLHVLGRSTLTSMWQGKERRSVVDFALVFRRQTDGSLRVQSDTYWPAR
ncbi:MAG TPA: alpha-L-fucosidase [Planctomycetota bacterium]|nr:alpha-L-fucosidase [Planctomycetota bacterium]